MRRLPLRAPALIPALLLLLASCRLSMPDVNIARMGPVPGGQVTEAVVGTPGPLNPLYEQEENARDIDSLIYQGLTMVDGRQQVSGLLAKDWQMSEDKQTYVVNLRPGIRWADGKPFNADDVMFTYQVLQSNDYQQPTTQSWKDIQVEKTGNLQVKFTLKAPSAGFPLALRQGIIAKHVFEGVPISTMASSPRSGSKAIGTGPFMVGSISPDRHTVTLDRNPLSRQAPYLDHLVFRSYPALGDAVDAVSRGDADMVGAPELDQIGTLAKRPDLTLIQRKTFSSYAVLFNLSPDMNAYFNPPAVRQALNQAIDRKKIVRDVMSGNADPAPGPIPPTSWAYAADKAGKLPYDPAAATKLLQDSGWQMNVQSGLLSRGGKDFSVELVTADAYPYKPAADAISVQLRQLGIQVRVQPVPLSVLVSKYLIGKQYQMALAAFDNGPDPDEYSYWHSGASRDTVNFANPPMPRQALIDKDLEDGRAGKDRGSRVDKYADFQDLMADAAPAMFLFEPHYTYVVSKRVHGVHTNPVIEAIDRFEYVNDWYVTTR
jgi:peptide/nickel transport system substrate-binding protein